VNVHAFLTVGVHIMFFFVTTLRHPDNAKDYQAVIHLLSLTIESVSSQQTSVPYKFLIVCNKKPHISVDENKVIFHIVDFPSPGLGRANQLSFDSFLIDKGTKIAAGLLFLKSHSPSKIFIIDADDWVHNKIVEHVAAAPNTDFWYANGGYLLNLGDKKSIRKYGLCRYCGSTFIYDYKKLMEMVNCDNELSENSSKEEMIAGIKEFPLLNILGNHRCQLAYIRKFGWKIKPIPFKAVCWVVNTGENHSGKTGGHQGLPLKFSLLSQFGITSILASEEKNTISSCISEAAERLKSYLGWLVTNKTKTKV
jgi:hypothetical protein